MDHVMLPRRLSGHGRFGLLYVANFVLSFHLFFVVYMNSSFLAGFVGERFVGLIFGIGALGAIAALLSIPRILRQFGNYRLATILAILEMVFFVTLAAFQNALIVIPAFIAVLVIYPLLLFNLDIFLEAYTEDETATGGIRGMFLTTTNTALIIAPFLAGLILTDGDYWKIYLISALLIVPFIALLSRFRNFRDPIYFVPKIADSARAVFADRDIRNIFVAQFIMRLSFVAMVIYLPVYLHGHIGFSWSEFGIIAAIMLLPFALFELPAGKLADTRFGEKEMLLVGFAIAGTATAVIPFFSSENLFVWAGLLFVARAGMSLIEIMTEAYFFKHVRGENDNAISFFRILNPLSYVVGPLVATLFLLFFDLPFVFLLVAATLFLGIGYGAAIRDTR